jgi:WD40 repeat protein
MGQIVKKPRTHELNLWLVLLVLLVEAIVLLMVVGYFLHWPWMGFQHKTLWDWLQYLILPVALTLAPSLWLTLRHGEGRGQARSRWRLFWLVLLAVFLVAFTIGVIGGYAWGWTWTGFQKYVLWEWIELLLLPVALVALSLWLNEHQKQFGNERGKQNGQPPSQPESPSSPSPRFRINRRSALAFLFGATAIVSVGTATLVWDILKHRVVPAIGSSPTPPVPATPVPGTTILHYQGYYPYGAKAVAWSPDGQHIASGSNDRMVQIWDAITGQHVIYCHGHTDEVKSVAWHPKNGQHLASGSIDGTIRIWDVTGKQLGIYQGFTAEVRSVAWSPDGNLIAGGAGSPDHTVRIWNTTRRDSTPVCIYRGHNDQVITIAWSPDGGRIASASFDGTVQIWNVSTKQTYRTYRGHPSGARAVAWSPDGNYIASGGGNRTVQVWDANNGQLIQAYAGHTKDIQAVAWSPPGQSLASGSFDGTVKIWDIATGKNAYTYPQHLGTQVWDVAWSPKRQLIVSSSVGDSKHPGTVRVWWAL